LLLYLKDSCHPGAYQRTGQQPISKTAKKAMVRSKKVIRFIKFLPFKNFGFFPPLFPGKFLIEENV